MIRIRDTYVKSKYIACIRTYVHTAQMYIRRAFHVGQIPTTDHILDHEGPVTSHAVEELVDVDFIFLLQPLHHCVNSNEGAAAANTSTVSGHTNRHTDEHN